MVGRTTSPTLNRGLLATVALLGLLLVALWFVDREREARRSEAGAGEVARSLLPAAELAPAQALEDLEGDSEVEAGRRPAAPESTDRVRADEAARVRWVQGQVLFPPGTPADEEVFVAARGQRIEWRRWRVRPDGSFSVTFPERSKQGWLALEARYVYLDRLHHWKQGETEPIVLEPELGGRIEGRLVVPEGSEDEVGGQVTLLAPSLDVRAQHVVEIQDVLAFSFEGLRPEEARLEYEGERFWSAPLETTIEAGRTRSITLELHRGVTLIGRVVGADGRPMAGAWIAARSLGTARERSSESASDGSFALRGLSPPTILLRAGQADFVDLQREFDGVTEGETREGIELVMGDGTWLEGLVLFPDGITSLARVHVVSGEKVHEVETKEDGRFRLSGIGPGPFRVHACDTTSGTWKAVAENVEAGTNDLVLVLQEGLALPGRVIDDAGAPVEGAKLVATPSDAGPGGFDESVYGQARDDGSFTLQGLRPGPHLLYISSDEHEPIEPIRILVPTEDAVIVTLPRGASVEGVVRDPSGTPVPGARVAVKYEKGAWKIGASDAHGAFELAGLLHGRLSLSAQAPPFAPSEPVALELAAGERQSGFILRLREGARIMGEVRDWEGKPIAWASITIPQEMSELVRSDGEGRFELSGVLPGEVRVSARTTGGLTLEALAHAVAGETAYVRLEVARR